MSRRRIAYGPQGPGHLPEAIVVDVPDYCGPHTFYPGHPKWVPILEMQGHKDGSKQASKQTNNKQTTYKQTNKTEQNKQTNKQQHQNLVSIPVRGITR